MVAFRQILCPVDYSDCSRHGLDHALGMADTFGGTVTALHVVPVAPYADPVAGAVTGFPMEDLKAATIALEKFVANVAGSAPVTCMLRHGSVARTILVEAETLPADLIVVGTHGRSGFEHLMLGSVAERVLRKAACPVLTVPRRTPGVPVSAPITYRRILCATDFSAAAVRAMGYAESLALQMGAELTILHSIEPISSLEPLPSEIGMALRAARTAMLTKLGELAPPGIKLTKVVTEGKPYREILTRAEQSACDLIVIGAHGAFTDRFHLGSTTNHLVRQAPCPVLSLRA